MDKVVFLESLLEALRKELQIAINASKDAADYATNEESKASSQWDTQGLEASYLAAGQAGQARQWALAIEDLQGNREVLCRRSTQVALGALFAIEFDGVEEWFFYARVAGGQVVLVDEREVTVMTTQSPLAGRVRGLKAGECFRLANGRVGLVSKIE